MLDIYYYWYCLYVYIYKSIRYRKLSCLIISKRAIPYARQYLARKKYFLFINCFTYINWYRVVIDRVFMNTQVYVRVFYLRLLRGTIRLNRDVALVKRRFYSKLFSKGAWGHYKRNKLWGLNVITKVLRQVKWLRRDWHQLTSVRLHKKKAGFMYSWMYKRFCRSGVWYILNLYLMVMGSKFILVNKWYKFYRGGYGKVCYSYLKTWLLGFYYIGLSKWYLTYLILGWQYIKRLRVRRGRVWGKSKQYFWQLQDVPQCVEVDYFTLTSFQIWPLGHRYYLYNHILIYLHWEFINFYNWKHFY